MGIIASITCVLLVLPALAGEREQAELERLVVEEADLAGRQAWPGVERAYQQMIALAADAVPFEAHYEAAEAARARGDMGAALERLERAAAIRRSPELDSWLADIRSHFGRVELMADPPRPVPLEAEQTPFAPDQRLQVELASRALASQGRFVGLLPVGRYTLAGRPFEVTAGLSVSVELSGRDLRRYRRRSRHR